MGTSRRVSCNHLCGHAGMEGDGLHDLERTAVIHALAKQAGSGIAGEGYACLTRTLGNMTNATSTGTAEPQSWTQTAAHLRQEAHQLATAGSNDCAIIRKRVTLHQEAAEAYRRSGEQSHSALNFYTGQA